MKKSEVVKNNRDFDRIIQKGQLKKIMNLLFIMMIII